MDPTPKNDIEATRPATRSVLALMSHLIDYAGLFPPASLDMAATVRHYASYLASDDEWMLNRIIVPVSRLEEFEQAVGDVLPIEEDADPWLVSALTVAADDVELGADFDRIINFNARHAERRNGAVLIDVIELKADSSQAIDAALDRVPGELFPFFELPASADPRGPIAALSGGDAGAKIRTGGVTAEAYPTPAQVARFICACASAGVPFKATAGLHHPLRHHAEAVDTMEFGFLNVFVAAALSLHRKSSEETVIRVLEENVIEAFSFGDDRVNWRDHQLTLDEFEDARLKVAISFGSCSFDEPREDLRSLGLL